MKKLFILLFLFLLFASTIFAAPHITRSVPEPREYPGRTLRERFAPNVPEGLMAAAPISYATATSVHVLFLRVEFPPDTDALTTGSGEWTHPLYVYKNGPDYWINRAKTGLPKYWNEVSYGLLTVTIDVSPKIYVLPQKMTSYAGSTAGPIENFIYDSITTASTDTALNFSQYDGVFIVHAGVGQETDSKGIFPNDLWSLYYRVDTIFGETKICRDASHCVTTTLKDGKVLSEAIIMPQTDMRTDAPPVDALGVYVHEFGHWLGLPDLYCILSDQSKCPSEGVGSWSLMDQGSYNIDPATLFAGHAELPLWKLSRASGCVEPHVSGMGASSNGQRVSSVSFAGPDSFRASADNSGGGRQCPAGDSLNRLDEPVFFDREQAEDRL